MGDDLGNQLPRVIQKINKLKPEINSGCFEGDPVFCRECMWAGKSGELILDIKKEMFGCPECGCDVNVYDKNGKGRQLSKPPF